MDEQLTAEPSPRAPPQRPRRQTRLARSPRRRLGPLHHAQYSLLRGPHRGRPRAARAQRRNHTRGNRHRFSRRSRGDSNLEGRGRRRPGRARPFRARHVPRARATQRATRIHATRAQPRAQRAHRRQEHGVRSRLRLAVRAQSRRGSPLRAHRGFPQLREARLSRDIPCTTRAARSASPSTCRSTSAISTWSTAI